MKVTRIKENSQLLNMVADMLQSGLVSNTPEAIVYVVTILSDISRSLAIIANTMSEAVGDDPSHPFTDDADPNRVSLGNIVINEQGRLKYCPVCGSRMKGEDDEAD